MELIGQHHFPRCIQFFFGVRGICQHFTCNGQRFQIGKRKLRLSIILFVFRLGSVRTSMVLQVQFAVPFLQERRNEVRLQKRLSARKGDAAAHTFKKGLLTVIITLIIGCLVQVALALLCNRFIMFPMFFGTEAATFFGDLWVFVACFNLIKSVAISVVTIILYKRISGFIKGI